MKRLAILGLALLLSNGSPSAQTGKSAPSGGDRWGASWFPNVELTTHEGRRVRFFDDLIEGKVVVINFIYTTCPDVCPLETAKLAELQAILGKRVGQDVFLYSITIDPETDTPEVLADYAALYGAGPGWLFLTGVEADIVELRKRLGLYIADIQGEESNDHNVSLIIGNQATGRWMKRSPFDDPYYLADNVGSWLHNWKTPSINQDSYANAPALDALTTGARLFKTRCSSCHVIGEEVPAHQSGRLLGPDLLGVVDRRDPLWLARWLTEPDKMLAAGDPLALELFEKHQRVPMPNMSLTQTDVSALLEFLEVESRRVEASSGSQAAANRNVPTDPEAACCQKGKGTLSAGLPEEETRPVPRELMIGSFGLGVALILASTQVRRRPNTPTKPANVPQNNDRGEVQ